MNLLKLTIIVTILTTLGGGVIYKLMPAKKESINGKELYEEYFVPEPLFSRGYDNFIEDEYKMKADGMSAYKSRNYLDAIKFFEDYLNEKATDLQVPYYLGVSYMTIDSMNKAEAQFNRLLQSSDYLYYDNSQWYAALIAIYKADYAKAKDLLSKIVANKNHTFLPQAEELLKKLDM